jgi:pimeloyl-ACP methyl ester carboxylesterase
MNRCVLFAATVAVLMSGCVPIRQIRTLPPPQLTAESANVLAAPVLATHCDVGSASARENRKIIEDYGAYLMGYAEFDDQGWGYAQDSQLQVLQARLQAEVKNQSFVDQDFALIVFVHGWHHNAHDNDCNVQEARQMVAIASARFDAAYAAGHLKRKRRVVGIYVGWRGESVDAALLRYTTVIDRRDAAEKVAKGSIRQLFANLHELQIAAQAATDRTDALDRSDRMYTTVVGHSFGGLIVFNSLSQQLINDLTAEVQNQSASSCSTYQALGAALPAQSAWPDEVILINPAFEASRLEPLNRLADISASCGYSGRVPLLTVITADNDRWTGPVFTAARGLLTLFEGYDDSTRATRDTERDANVHAIGFVRRYRTHRTCLLGQQDARYATASAAPDTNSATPSNVPRPLWVVGAPPAIVNGHDGFLYARPGGQMATPYLLNWLIDRHLDPASALSAPGKCGPWPPAK